MTAKHICFMAVVVLSGLCVYGGLLREPALIFNEDNTFYFCKFGADKMNEAALRDYVDVLANSKVTHFFMCPNGQRTSCRSSVHEAIWDPPNTESTNIRWCANARMLFEKGIDPYAVWTDQCRKRGISPWVTLRMNDVHWMTDSTHFQHTVFWRTHPELWRVPFCTETGKTSTVWVKYAFDYSKRAVYDYQLALVREVLERYDVDGIELDWMRFCYHLTPGKEREQAGVLTVFMRDARGIAREWAKRRGHPIGVSARVPSRPETARALGMDAAAWAADGSLDLLVPTPQYSCEFDMPLARWREWLGAADVEVIPGTDYLVKAHPRAPKVLLTSEIYAGWADAMRARGARSFYVFNMRYLMRDGDDAIRMLRAGLGDAAVQSQTRRYLLSCDVDLMNWAYEPQLPRETGQPLSFRLATGMCPEKGTAALILGLAKTNGQNKAMFSVTLNGTPLEPCGDALFRKRYGEYLTGRAIRYTVPLKAVNDLENEVAVRQTAGATQQIVWVELELTPPGEHLYNGIVLPEAWPPATIDAKDTAPMAVPYLKVPPVVIPIDVGRQLFVDDFLIASNTLTRVFHSPEKYTKNPVLKPETPLELCGEFDDAAVVKGGGLWWDPAAQVFKLWYEAGWLRTLVYATSRDGLHWERPSLDVVPDTNQVLPPDLVYDSGNVVPDWDAKDPQQRWKMFFRDPGGNGPGMSLTSPDGIQWTNRTATGVCGDRSTFFYNPFRKKWVYSLRSGFPGRGRARDYWECADFLAGAAWPAADGRKPVRWAAADRDDPKDPAIGRVPQLYNLDAVAYESIMLGAFEIHHGPENGVCERRGLPKITDINFAYSRDGFHWDRPDRRAHIASSRWYSEAWDRGYVQPLGNLCTARGDTLWFYYSGFRGDPMKTNRVNQLNGMHQEGATGVAFLRRDGFASLETGAEAGTLTTRPVVFSGARVFVNAAAAKGELRAEILNERGEVIKPYTLANCKPVAEDSTLAAVEWQGAADVAALRGKPVRFRFSLRNGALYAFWVSRDATGRSDGYVAGGGPGFTGPTDTVGRAALEAERRLDVKR
jgi:hypothetical protein